MKKNIFVVFFIIAVISFCSCVGLSKNGQSENNGLSELQSSPIGQVVSEQYKNVKQYKDGNISNTVVFLTFEREGDLFVPDFYDSIERMYNTASFSLKNYYYKQSSGKVEINTNLIYAKGGGCVRSEHSADYYKPKYVWRGVLYEEVNKNGYDNRKFDKDGSPVDPSLKGAKPSIDGFYREQLLIREILTKLNLPNEYFSDYDQDGKTDSFVIITDADVSSSDWGDILWSHMSMNYSLSSGYFNDYYYTKAQQEQLKTLSEAYLGESVIGTYNFFTASEICARKAGDYSKAIKEDEKGLYDVGLLCHEMAHNLGFYDYYSYEDSAYQSIGEFDITANDVNVVPQNMLTYLRAKAGWLSYENMLYVNDSGRYTIYPVGADKQIKACKIVLSDYLSTGEYYMVEARSKNYADTDNPFDSCLTDSGIIIMRINEGHAYINASGEKSTTDYGNMYGEDEVYVYRTQSSNLVYRKNTSGQRYSLSQFNGSEGMSSFTVTPSTGSTIQNSARNIVFSDICANDDGSFSFTVELPEQQSTIAINIDESFIGNYFDGSKRVYWKSNVKTGNAHILVLRSTDRLKRLAENHKSKITFSDIKKGTFNYYVTLYKTVIPISEMSVPIPDFNEQALVFVALESENGNCAIRYIGCIENDDESFSGYLARMFDPLYVAGIAAGIFVIILIVLFVLYLRKNSKKVIRRKKT